MTTDRGHALQGVTRKISDVSLRDWVHFAGLIITGAIMAGMWYQSDTAESVNLTTQIASQSELFSDRITSLSNRINTLETKQGQMQADVGEIKGQISGIAKDLSFLSQTITARGVERDRQMIELKTEQQEVDREMTKEIRDLAQDLADHRVLLERALPGVTDTSRRVRREEK